MIFTNPFTGFAINSNEEGCNQYTGPNCGGVVRKGLSSPTSKGTRVSSISEEAHPLVVRDSNEDEMFREIYPTEDKAIEQAAKLAKGYRFTLDKNRFKKTGYFRSKGGARIWHDVNDIPLGEEEEGPDFSATHLDRQHLQRMLDKIRARKS